MSEAPVYRKGRRVVIWYPLMARIYHLRTGAVAGTFTDAFLGRLYTIDLGDHEVALPARHLLPLPRKGDERWIT